MLRPKTTQTGLDQNTLHGSFGRARAETPADPLVAAQAEISKMSPHLRKLPSPLLPHQALQEFHEPLNVGAKKRLFLVDVNAAKRVYRGTAVSSSRDVVVLVHNRDHAEEIAWTLMDSRNGRKNVGLQHIFYMAGVINGLQSQLTRETMKPREHTQQPLF